MLIIRLVRAGDPSETVLEERTFIAGRLTIGRAAECDWTLKDQSRSVSKLHCELFNRGSQVFVSDQSTNGTFLNGSTQRIDGIDATEIRAGDRLRIGDFVLSLHPDTERQVADDLFAPAGTRRQSAPSPLDEWSSPQRVETGVTDRIGKSSIDDLIGNIGDRFNSDPLRPATIPEPPPGRGDLSAAFVERKSAPKTPSAGGGAIPADWGDDPLGDPLGSSPTSKTPGGVPPLRDQIPDDFLAAPVAPAQPAAGARVAAPIPDSISERIPAPERNLAGGSQDLYAAFLEGAGLSAADVAGEDAASVLREAGAVYREAVKSYSGILRDRSFLRNEFRIERTLIATQGNNPLKFFDPDEAAAKLLKKPEKGFLGGAAAVREAGADVKKHQISVLAGLRLALQSLLDRFKPETILAALAPEKSTLPRLGGETARARRAWEKFQDIHASCEDEVSAGQDNFLNQAFRRGYEQQMSELDKS